VKFSPLSAEAKEKNWRGIINEEGNVHTSFTTLGYMESGSPSEIEIIDPLTNAVVQTVALGEITSPIVLDLDENNQQGDMECPMIGDPSSSQRIASTTEYAICSYHDDGSLYYTYYYGPGHDETYGLMLDEEWFRPNSCGDLPAHVKYRSDYTTKTWVHYTCQLDEKNQYFYGLAGSGTL